MVTKKTFTKSCKSRKCCSYLRKCVGKKCKTKRLACKFNNKCRSFKIKKSKFKRCGKVKHSKIGNKQCRSRKCCSYKRVCNELNGFKNCHEKKSWM